MVLEPSSNEDRLIPVNENVLTRLLAPFVSGKEKLVLFNHLNVRINYMLALKKKPQQNTY